MEKSWNFVGQPQWEPCKLHSECEGRTLPPPKNTPTNVTFLYEQEAYLRELEEEGQFSVSQQESAAKAAILENQLDIKVCSVSWDLLLRCCQPISSLSCLDKAQKSVNIAWFPGGKFLDISEREKFVCQRHAEHRERQEIRPRWSERVSDNSSS